jgi:hypothetical protein
MGGLLRCLRRTCLAFLPQLRHRPVQAALDPPLVDQQPVQYLGAGEVRHHHLPQDHLVLARAGLDRQPMLGPEHDVVRVLAVDRGEDSALQPLGPPKPPGQAHRPLGQHRFDRSHRRQFPQHPVPVAVKFRRVFSFDDHLLGQEPVPDGIL